YGENKVFTMSCRDAQKLASGLNALAAAACEVGPSLPDGAGCIGG
ncbi:unnamed protein product, partial [marine sediment metagenome]